MSYYYIVASLPTLVLGEPPPYSGEEMLRLVANVLEAGDLAELALVLEGREAEGCSAFAREWVGIEAQIRNAIVRERAAKLSIEARPHLREHTGYDVCIEKAVADAYAKPNPLERELSLDRLRWKQLEDRVMHEPFSLAAVLAFAVRLRIVSRWAALEEQAGRAKLDELLKAHETKEAAEGDKAAEQKTTT